MAAKPTRLMEIYNLYTLKIHSTVESNFTSSTEWSLYYPVPCTLHPVLPCTLYLAPCTTLDLETKYTQVHPNKEARTKLVKTSLYLAKS